MRVAHDASLNDEREVRFVFFGCLGDWGSAVRVVFAVGNIESDFAGDCNLNDAAETF